MTEKEIEANPEYSDVPEVKAKKVQVSEPSDSEGIEGRCSRTKRNAIGH